LGTNDFTRVNFSPGSLSSVNRSIFDLETEPYVQVAASPDPSFGNFLDFSFHSPAALDGWETTLKDYLGNGVEDSENGQWLGSQDEVTNTGLLSSCVPWTGVTASHYGNTLP